METTYSRVLVVLLVSLGIVLSEQRLLGAQPDEKDELTMDSGEPGGNRETKTRRQLEELLGWLPRHTESFSISVARGTPDFIALGLKPVSPAPSAPRPIYEAGSPPVPVRERPDFGQLVLDGNIGLFLALDDSFRRHFMKEKIVSAVSMVTSSRSELDVPIGLQNDACDVVLLADALSVGTTEALVELRTSVRRTAGGTMMVVPLRGRRGGRIYVAHPRPSVLMAATNEDDLAAVLRRMQHPHENGAASVLNLPQWRFIDRTLPAWGIWHRMESDGKQESSDTDKLILGGAFAYNPNEPSSVVVTHLCSRAITAHDIQSLWGVFTEMRPAVEAPAPAIFRVRLLLSAKDSPGVPSFSSVTAYLGVLQVMGYQIRL